MIERGKQRARERERERQSRDGEREIMLDYDERLD